MGVWVKILALLEIKMLEILCDRKMVYITFSIIMLLVFFFLEKYIKIMFISKRLIFRVFLSFLRFFFQFIKLSNNLHSTMACNFKALYD